MKRYLAECGSAWVESLCADEANNPIAIARFGLVETAAVFAAKRAGSSSQIANTSPRWAIFYAMRVNAIGS